MGNRNIELHRLMYACLDELRGIYTTEQSVRILLVLCFIHQLNITEPCNIEKLRWRRLTKEISIFDMLNDGLKELEYQNKQFEGIFTSLVTPSFHHTHVSSISALNEVIDTLRSYPFANQEEIVEFINLVAFSFSNNEMYGTPQAITKLLLGLIDIGQIHSFADYCSGISSVAIEMFRQLKMLKINNDISYYGEEINVSAYLISKLLMNVNRVQHFNIVNKDVLERVSNNGEELTFDFIFCDGPFGMAWNPLEAQSDPRYKYGIPPRSSADWAFYQNVLYHLKETGKALVVGTKGTLVRSTEVSIRKAIIEEDLIEAIITMPANLYYATSISTELIIFNKNKPQNRKDKILFIDASEYSHRTNRNQYTIADKDITKIIDTYRYGMEEERFSRFIDREKIELYNFSLNTKEYLDFDVLKDSFHQSVKLGDIAEIRRGVQLSNEEYRDLSLSPTHYLLNIKDIENGKITYDEAAKITYKKPDWLVKFAIRPMDILITSKGSAVKFAIVEDHCKEAFISGNLSIIRVDPKRYNSYVLYEFLQSEIGRRMIDGLQTGTTIKLINPSRLEQLEIPMFELDVMNEVGDQLKKNKNEYEESIREIEHRFETQKHVLIEQLGFNMSI